MYILSDFVFIWEIKRKESMCVNRTEHFHLRIHSTNIWQSPWVGESRSHKPETAATSPTGAIRAPWFEPSPLLPGAEAENWTPALSVLSLTCSRHHVLRQFFSENFGLEEYMHFKDYFIYVKGRYKERGNQSVPQISTMTGVGRLKWGERGTLFGSPMWLARTQMLGPSSTAFPGTLSGSWVGKWII